MKRKKFYAHSIEGESDTDRWQLLEEHLKGVAEKAAEFAACFEAREWAYLAGLWHDLGKYSTGFQSYLENQQEACAETQQGRVDHSTAGAQHAASSITIVGHLLAYTIAGHHTGMLDGHAEGTACQWNRLKKDTLPWSHGLDELPVTTVPELPMVIRNALGNHKEFSVAFFTRMLFSCLVDADFLDTESFLNPIKAKERCSLVRLEDLATRLYESLNELDSKEPEKPINVLRKAIRLECERATEQPPGFFSLTVPTGGGKTLSSVAFALRHALRHDLRRIIYVAPFTTIIEQNADVFRRYIGRDCVLEHHCNVDPDQETMANRLAAENWDAPLVVTTSVQFYESLFANRPSRCRKLHRIAKSVIILDEAQTIPVDYLHPCLRALNELVSNYNCTVVLCTATQPELKQRSDFHVGLEGVREIIKNPDKLYVELKRVEVRRIGRQSDAELRDRILREDRVLCIVNTVRCTAPGSLDTSFHYAASARA